MANEALQNELKNLYNEFRKLDNERLLRTSLGEESLENLLTPLMQEIERKFTFAMEFAPEVHDNHVNPIKQALNSIKVELVNQQGRSNTEYISQKGQFLQTLNTHLENIKLHWSPFVTTAIERRGFLQDEGIRKEYQETIADMKLTAEGTIKNVKDQTEKMLESAKQIAQQIEERARRTAAKISVEDAQKQFKEARGEIKIHIILWGILSGVTLSLFVLVAYYFMNFQPPKEWTWQVIYQTGLRITILAAIAAGATFSLRVLRAHIHIFQHNIHRQRLANSIASFVESAVTPEQRDLILTHLVDAIAEFGCSGLVKGEEDVFSPKMMIDNITRTISSTTKGT